MNTIYIFGHKNPDTDSICSAVIYANFLNRYNKKHNLFPDTKFRPARLGDLNGETKFLFEKFGLKAPKLLKKAKEGDKYILVDHNSYDESLNGLCDDMIFGILDHHKFVNSLNSPRMIRTEPIACTCSILYKIYKENRMKVPKRFLGIMLGSILSDSVVFKSSTCTNQDVMIAKELAKQLGLDDIESFGIEIKKHNVDFDSMDAMDLVTNDLKEYTTGEKRYAICQIEVVEVETISGKKQEILDALNKYRENNELNLVVMMVTNIMTKVTDLWISGEYELMEKTYGKKYENDSMIVENVMSRKKDLIPQLDKVIEE